MARDLKVGDLVPIFLPESRISGVKSIDKVGVITAIHSFKADVLYDGKIWTWVLADLKKMAAHKRNTVTSTCKSLST